VTDETDRFEPSPRIAGLVLGGAVLWIVALSWGYLTDGRAPYGNDHSAHLGLMLHVAELWRAGVTDLWWNQSNLGLPLFMAYQPLPGLASGTVAALLPDTAARLAWFKGTIVGFWALMPASWYVGARWMGRRRATALAFGLLTLAIHDLHDVGFGFSAAAYGGLYTQIWGMFFMPMAIGAFYRYVVDEEGSLWTPVLLFVLVSMSHLFCGMYAGIATLLMVVVTRPPRRGRILRMLAVYLPALALMAFWLGPLLATNDLAGGLPWKDEYYNGWPVAELFQHLLGGDVFDDGRFPWLTIAALVGVGHLARRRDEPMGRWWLALTAITLLLFMGRTNFGAWYDWVPMHAQINVMRYMNGVHFCGLWAAAHACVVAIRALTNGWSHHVWRRGDRIVVAVAALGATVSLLAERGSFVDEALKTFDQHDEHVAGLVDHLRKSRDHRFAVHEDLNTTPHFYRDLLPTLADRGQLQSYALGYHATLSTYYAEYLRYDPTWLRLFNVSELVAREPFERPVVERFQEVFHSGPYHVYHVPEADRGGYFDFVRTPVSISGDYKAIRPAVKATSAPLFEDRILPVLNGPTAPSRRADAPLLRRTDGPLQPWREGAKDDWLEAIRRHVGETSIDSTVRSSERGPNWYEARVDAAGGGERLLLKVNYFPFWHATVDGEPVPIDHVAPNFMAVDVPAGSHRVRFTYRNPWWQKLGACLSLLVLVVWGGATWARRT
jgi:hypothetical protein